MYILLVCWIESPQKLQNTWSQGNSQSFRSGCESLSLHHDGGRMHYMWLFQFNAILMQKYLLLDSPMSCFRDPQSVSAKREFPAHPVKNRCNCRTEFTTAWKTGRDWDLQLRSCLTHLHRSRWWLTAGHEQVKRKPSIDFVTGHCSSSRTQDCFYPVKKATLKALR